MMSTHQVCISDKQESPGYLLNWDTWKPQSILCAGRVTTNSYGIRLMCYTVLPAMGSPVSSCGPLEREQSFLTTRCALGRTCLERLNTISVASTGAGIAMSSLSDIQWVAAVLPSFFFIYISQLGVLNR